MWFDTKQFFIFLGKPMLNIFSNKVFKILSVVALNFIIISNGFFSKAYALDGFNCTKYQQNTNKKNSDTEAYNPIIFDSVIQSARSALSGFDVGYDCNKYQCKLRLPSFISGFEKNYIQIDEDFEICSKSSTNCVNECKVKITYEEIAFLWKNNSFTFLKYSAEGSNEKSFLKYFDTRIDYFYDQRLNFTENYKIIDHRTAIRFTAIQYNGN